MRGRNQPKVPKVAASEIGLAWLLMMQVVESLAAKGDSRNRHIIISEIE